MILHFPKPTPIINHDLVILTLTFVSDLGGN